MKKLFLFMALTCLVVCVAACGQDADADGSLQAPATPQVVFLFSPGGLGDMGYNDCILAGVQNFRKAHPDIDVFLSSPSTIEETERIFSDWMKRPGSDIPVVFVLASSDYEGLVERYLPDYPLADNKRILIFESVRRYEDPKITTFQISMYGASYLAGVTAGVCAGESSKSLVVLGSSSDAPIRAAKEGFEDGFPGRCDVQCLADDWSGFVMANAAYRNMSAWAGEYGFIFPVAGGSNAGIYRYTREFEDSSPFIAGMDVDQSSLSAKITGSVVKRFDILIGECFEHWLQTGYMPASQVYGLESGYVDWMLSPRYAPELSQVVSEARSEAIEWEKRYHEAYN